MSYKVSKTKDGRVLVLDDSGFAASFVDGKWVDKNMFDVYEMADEFRYVRDRKEAAKLKDEAYAAVRKVVTA